MWAVFTFMAYLLAALCIPLCLALVPVWRKTNVARQVTCPDDGNSRQIALDPCYAVRMHALGERELRVRSCGRWPEHLCNQECLVQIDALP